MQGHRQRGGQWCPDPPFKFGAPHFMFGPPVAAYIQYCILKCGPPLVFGPSFWFLAPPAAISWQRAWGDANLLLPNFYVLPALSSQLSVFSKLCIMNTLLHFLLLFQLCRSLRNTPLSGRMLGKSEVIITFGWVWWRHQRAPLFSLASVPPTLNPPLEITLWHCSTEVGVGGLRPQIHNQ